ASGPDGARCPAWARGLADHVTQLCSCAVALAVMLRSKNRNGPHDPACRGIRNAGSPPGRRPGCPTAQATQRPAGVAPARAHLQAADKGVQQGKPSSARTAWLQHARTSRAVPSADEEQIGAPLTRAHTWSALELDELFQTAQRVGSLEAALRLSGGSAADFCS